jgi:hypothetical protein
MRPFEALTGIYLALQGCNPAEAPKTDIVEVSSNHPNQVNFADCLDAAEAKTQGVLEEVLTIPQLTQTQVGYIRACLLEKEGKSCLPPEDAIFTPKSNETWDCTASTPGEDSIVKVWIAAGDESDQSKWQKEEDIALKKAAKKCKGGFDASMACVKPIREKIESEREEALKEANPDLISCQKGYVGDITKGRTIFWVCETPLKAENN